MLRYNPVRSKTLIMVSYLVLAVPGALPAESPQKTSEPFWTAVEEKEYEQCLPHAIEVWKNRKVAEDQCVVSEERKRWLRNHPQFAAKKEDKAKMQQCLQSNTAKINGTREEFRITFDRCLDEAYGVR